MNVQTLQEKIISLCPTQKPTIILGLSGGPDSVFLFHLLQQLYEEKKINLIAAHLNHGWRETAAHDQLFCKTLCEKYSVPFEVKHAREITEFKKTKGSKEEEGRNKRRAFFEELAKKYSAHAIALAQHTDDQIETFLLRLMRGSSLDGLCGIQAKSGLYIRPLLAVFKEEIVHYLKHNNYDYCSDESNESDAYLRNRIRHNAIPALEQCDSRFKEKTLSSLHHLQEENIFLKELTQQTFETVFTSTDSGYEGNLTLFKNLHPTLQRRVVLLWLIKEKAPFKPSLGHLDEILRFLRSNRGGKHNIYSKASLTKAKNYFRFEKHN